MEQDKLNRSYQFASEYNGFTIPKLKENEKCVNGEEDGFSISSFYIDNELRAKLWFWEEKEDNEFGGDPYQYFAKKYIIYDYKDDLQIVKKEYIDSMYERYDINL